MKRDRVIGEDAGRLRDDYIGQCHYEECGVDGKFWLHLLPIYSSDLQLLARSSHRSSGAIQEIWN